MYAVKWAITNGYSEIEIRYDYEGIAKWITGEWKAKNELTKKYVVAMNEWKKSIQISFYKVVAHSNNKYNDMADALAKSALTEGDGIPKIKKGMLIGTLFTFGSQNKLYKRSFLEQQNASFPEGVVYEEPYFVYPLLFEAERFYSMEDGLYFYRQTEQSVTSRHMDKKTILYDHPFVQLELLKKLVSNKTVSGSPP